MRARALTKLQARLRQEPKPAADRAASLAAEDERLWIWLARLTAALAGGTSLSSVLDAIREREQRRAAISTELAVGQAHSARRIPEVRRWLSDWRAILTTETGQARPMLPTLLDGRIVFTPHPESESVEFRGRGDYWRLFAGLIDLSLCVGVPNGTSSDVWRGFDQDRISRRRERTCGLTGFYQVCPDWQR